jgi:hypothetical protein
MGYTIKNGKLHRPQHDQKRADRICRSIRDMTVQISEAEYMDIVGQQSPGVVHIMCAHEDWCRTMQTGAANDCTCKPTITYHKQLRPDELH